MAPRRIPQGKSVKVRSGSFNAFVDAADYVQNARTSGGAARGFDPSPSIVLMKNLTSADVPRWGALKPYQPVVLPATDEVGFLSQVVMEGIGVGASSVAFVALDPVPMNEFGRFLAPGHVVPVKINKDQDITYKLARPGSTSYFNAVEDADVENDDRLVDVIWHETGTGQKWALVLLPGIRSARLTILGPCATFTTPAELPDTDFATVWPGGCEGPNLLGLNYRTIGSPTTTIVPLFLESTSPFILSSAVFSHSCVSSSVDVYIELQITTSLALGNAELRFHKASDDSVWVKYRNGQFSFLPNTGGNMQFGPDQGPCNCITFPFDLCLSVPTR